MLFSQFLSGRAAQNASENFKTLKRKNINFQKQKKEDFEKLEKVSKKLIGITFQLCRGYKYKV